MAAITVRGLDDEVRDALRRRAQRHGRSMEAEVREILAEQVRLDLAVPNALMELHVLTREEAVELDIPARTHVSPRETF